MMRKYLHTQNGSSAVLAILVMTFLGIIIAGLLPMVTAQVSLSSANKDLIEAQFAAEAGAKRAIVGLTKNRTDWTWANGSAHNIFDDGTTTKYYVVNISPPITDTNKPAAGTTYTITSDGYVGNAHKKATTKFNTPSASSGITSIPVSSGCMGTMASPSGGISVNYAKILTNAANPPALGAATRLGNQSMPPTYDYASYKSHANPYTLHTQNVNNNLYYYDGNLTLVQNDNLTGTSGNNAVLFVNGTITLSGGGMNINNVILVATGDIIAASGSGISFSNSVLISNSNITFNSLALLQPAVLITPGIVSFNNGVTWNNSASADSILVGLVNSKMQPYAIASGVSGSGSGTSIPYNWNSQ